MKNKHYDVLFIKRSVSNNMHKDEVFSDYKMTDKIGTIFTPFDSKEDVLTFRIKHDLKITFGLLNFYQPIGV